MKASLRIGIVGDFNPESLYHLATNAALDHAAAYLSVAIDSRWLATPLLDHGGESVLNEFDALWCSPGSPYASMFGALNGIQFARERDVPFLGT